MLLDINGHVSYVVSAFQALQLLESDESVSQFIGYAIKLILLCILHLNFLVGRR